jgi:hypothetical protein
VTILQPHDRAGTAVGPDDLAVEGEFMSEDASIAQVHFLTPARWRPQARGISTRMQTV